jgi:hypothetical protein
VKSYFSAKFIVIIMLMLSLIGQSSASVMMSCDMMNMSDIPMAHNMDSSGSMMHISMDMPMAADDGPVMNMVADCCQENCDCATTTCKPNSYTNSLMTLSFISFNTENNSLHIALPQEQFLNYLFKPPIL